MVPGIEYFRILLICLIGFSSSFPAVCQDADGNVDTLECRTSIDITKQKLALMGTSKHLVYDLAADYSLIGETDSSFVYLEMAIDHDFPIIDALTARAFINVRNTSIWPEYRKKISGIWYEKYPDGDIEYATAIIRMEEEDQVHRAFMEYELEKYGPRSEQTILREKLTILTDSLHMVKLDSLIEHKGWPDASKVGRHQLQSACILILHADVKYQKKFLPFVKNSISRGELPERMLAFLTDKICVAEGRNQVYGTQLTRDGVTGELQLYPVKDFVVVDSLRISMGLDSIHSYLEYMKSVY